MYSPITSRLILLCGTLAAVCLTDDTVTVAQTIQLPSISRFSYSGSVLVPVQGETSLGGVSRSSRGRTRRGGFAGGGAALGQGASIGGLSARVTVIDHDAIDRQLRGLPPRHSNSRMTSRSGQNKQTPKSVFIDRTQKTNTSAAPKDPDAEGKSLVRFARSQYKAGKKASSYNAYQLAISKLSPKLAKLAQSEFHRVFGVARLQPTQSNR